MKILENALPADQNEGMEVEGGTLYIYIFQWHIFEILEHATRDYLLHSN